jgi:hypothetical protein
LTEAELFSILKHSKNSTEAPDQTNMKVISNLHKHPDYAGDKGWKLKTWERELTLKVKNKLVTKLHKKLYLIHEPTGNFVTSQARAWCDTVVNCMVSDLVKKPLQIILGGKLLDWGGNCGPHKTEACKKVNEENGIDTAFLAPQVTGTNQVISFIHIYIIHLIIILFTFVISL